MIVLRLIDIIYLITFFQLMLFSIFLFTIKKNRISNRLLAFFLLSQAIAIFDFLIRDWSNFFLPGFHFLFYLGLSAIFLWGPTLFFYVRSITDNKGLTRKDFIHFLPSIIFLLFLVFRYHSQGLNVKLLLIDYCLVLSKELFNWICVLNYFLIIVYIFECLVKLKTFEGKLKKEFSSNNSINYRWIKSFLYFYIFSAFISLVQFTISQYFQVDIIHVVVMLLFLVFFTNIFYKALTTPEIFIGKEVKEKYESSSISEAELSEIKNALHNYMISTKPYLRLNLKLDELANEIDTVSWKLSQVINKSFAQPFWDYVNKYRIDEAKKILEKDSSKNILEVLFEVGFNSKSAFNRAFKKHEGITPSQFRKNCEKNRLFL